jgi:hypothetical protein
MAKQKKTLEGFGSPTKSGQGNLHQTLKKVGDMLGTKGVRPVGGNVTGVTSATRGNVGDVKLKPIGGKGICCTDTGKGPKEMPDNCCGMTTKDLGGMNKSGLGKKEVRDQP